MKIVFDIGGSKTRIASSNDGKTLSEPIIFRTPADPSIAMEKIGTTAKDMAGEKSIEIICGGIAGVLNPKRTTLVAASNLPRWQNFNIADALSKTISTKIVLANDAALGALGEANFGAGKDFKRILYYSIGTGVGGAWVVNSDLPSYGTFEPGHHIIDWNTLTTVENYIDNASTPAEQAHAVALGVYNSLLHWPSNIIILGGGKTIHKSWTEEQVYKEIVKLSHEYIHIPDLVFAKLGDQTGLFGALTLANKTQTP